MAGRLVHVRITLLFPFPHACYPDLLRKSECSQRKTSLDVFRTSLGFFSLGFNALFTVLPHWETCHNKLTPSYGRPVMFRGPIFILSTMQAGTTTILSLWYDWTQHQSRVKPMKPLGQCYIGPPYCLLLQSAGTTEGLYLSPGSSVRSPHPGPQWVAMLVITCLYY